VVMVPVHTTPFLELLVGKLCNRIRVVGLHFASLSLVIRAVDRPNVFA
jgi:hypothetical protein